MRFRLTVPANSCACAPLCRSEGLGWDSLDLGSARLDLDGFADFAPTGEVPCVGEAGALDGFHGLNAAVAAIQEDASAIGLVGERESVASRAEPGYEVCVSGSHPL